MLYERIHKEYLNIQKQIHELETELSQYPKGKLICCHHGKHCKWYQSDGHKKSYIPKANRPLAEQLAKKKYLSCLLRDLLHEKRALEFYLDHHRPCFEKSTQLLTEISGYQELLAPFFKPLSRELSDWMTSPYETNPKHPENLIHKTTSGNMVRSKSEAMIDHFLYINKIPFRYESRLQLNNITLYPDFSIRHPVTGELYYWEHFGLMDDPAYSKNAISKLQLYTSHGIIPTIQLIITYETLEHPLGTEIIQKTIEHYFF